MGATVDVYEPKKRFSFTEDWAVVLLGFIIILLSVVGFMIPVPGFDWKTGDELITKVLAANNLLSIALQFFLVFIVSMLAAILMNKPIKNSLAVFPVVYVLTVIAMILAGNSGVKALNLEAVIFSLAVGLLIGNVFRLPLWFRDALSTELFVKIGLVLLGTSIIFSDILKAGSLGLIQALIVVVSVWYFAYWLCKKLGVDDELTMMISSSVSICGVSAAIATAGAIHGDTKKLSYVISLVLITAIPMMIFMPLIAKYFGFSEEVTGAWLGGSIDTTGAVVASGTLVGETALKISTIVKFSQNVLLGLAAFAISVYWTYAGKGQTNEITKPTFGVIWERFPKFVLGFVLASLLFSFMLSSETVSHVKGSLKSIQTLWFVLAFTSIGLETKFSDLFNSSSKRPLYAFLIAQVFNILVTLLIANLLFR
ncbi:MAG: YeiH family protein [Cyclobacteriaceae bacterium]|nr:YeiH family protein [Cyclobacteriaceae bacterium]MDH4296890.1 YeiH family protein [Cyclobacteriaceae bacterium]MDH5250916.1 YeiH family protein [Cyclobacteriaceae bacterium]